MARPKKKTPKNIFSKEPDYPDLRPRVKELEQILATVNKSLGSANDQADAARVDAMAQRDREGYMLSKCLDVKAQLLLRGDMEDAILVQKLAQVEMRSTSQVTVVAAILQKAKALAELPEFDESLYRDFIKTAQMLG